MLTSEKVKEFARKKGADLVGIASINRFEEAPPYLNPLNIFPETKSIIIIGMRYLRGAYRGIEEGTYWWSYAIGESAIDSLMLPMVRNEVRRFIEEHGWEAVQVEPLAAYPEYEGLRAGYYAPSGRLPPDVSISVRFAAVAAGLGEIGYSKVFLSPQFGPRQRLTTILTDAPLTPDPLFKGKICDRCMRCVEECPSGAISATETVKLNIAGKTLEWGKIDTGKCKLSHTGINPKISPFVAKDLPGFHLDVSKQNMSWIKARSYAENLWNLIRYSRNCRDSGFYPIGCGARGCIRACMIHLEEKRKISNKFVHPFRKRKAWLLSG